jgi:hypothetical protein
MRPLDYLKALGVGFATLVVTLAASYPMVAFYAYFIEPGHPQEFYTAAAQWIAPWSSYVLGPIVLFCFNYWMAKRVPRRNAMLFAVATVVAYIAVDFGMLPLMGIDLRVMLDSTVAVSLAAKLAGALLGASLGKSRRARPAAAAA